MTDSLWRRLVHGSRRVRERADWGDFAGPNWSERIMETPVTDCFHAKQGRSTGRLILEAGGRRLSVYLKRHYRLPRLRSWLATLWPGRGRSPAMEEWRNLEWARSAGLPVPSAVAAAEYIGPWGRLQSCLAVEELAGMLPLHEAIPLAERRLGAGAFQSWKAGLTAELARLTRMLHGLRRFHKDLYLCHFYIQESDIPLRRDPEGSAQPPKDCWRGRVYLIDLHRLGHHPWTWPWWRVKDLAQLLYSSEVAGVTVRDRLRFWRYYLGGGVSAWGRAWLRWLVLFRWRNYRRHNLGV